MATTQDYKLPPKFPGDPNAWPVTMPKQEQFDQGYLPTEQPGSPANTPYGGPMAYALRQSLGAGGGFGGILAKLLGGVQNQPVGMPSPVDPSAGAAPSQPQGSIFKNLGNRGGVSPALSSVLTGSESAPGGETNNIQALLAQLLKRGGKDGGQGGGGGLAY